MSSKPSLSKKRPRHVRVALPTNTDYLVGLLTEAHDYYLDAMDGEEVVALSAAIHAFVKCYDTSNSSVHTAQSADAVVQSADADVQSADADVQSVSADVQSADVQSADVQSVSADADVGETLNDNDSWSDEVSEHSSDRDFIAPSDEEECSEYTPSTSEEEEESTSGENGS
jgi:cobalamin biosynthesis protein CobT